jgi:hypothetical protein
LEESRGSKACFAPSTRLRSHDALAIAGRVFWIPSRRAGCCHTRSDASRAASGPLFCRSALSGAAFLRRFDDADDFYAWVEVFDKVGLHLKNVWAEGERAERATTEDSSVARLEGSRRVRRSVKHRLDRPSTCRACRPGHSTESKVVRTGVALPRESTLIPEKRGRHADRVHQRCPAESSL